MDTSLETQADLELKLYVLRSDFNRAVNYADQLRKELIELREAVAQRSAEAASADLFTQDTALLVARVSELARENEEAQRLIGELRAELARCASAVDGQGGALRAEVEALTARMKVLSDQSNRLQAERDQVAAEGGEAKNLAMRLGEEKERLTAALASEKAQARRLTSDKEALAAELQDTQRELVAVRSNLSKMRTECEELEVNLVSATRVQRRHEERANSLAEELEAAAAKSAELEPLRRAYSTSIAELKTATEALQAQERTSQAYKEQISKFESSLSFLEQRGNELETALAQSKVLIDTLREEGRLADQVKQLISTVDLVKPAPELANLPARDGEIMQPVAVDQQLQEFGHQFRQELDQRRDQIIQTMENAALEAAAKIEKRLEVMNSELLAETRFSNRDLRAGLLSRFQMIASEVSIMRRVRADQGSSVGDAPSRLLYIDLLERALTGIIYGDAPLNTSMERYDPEERLRGWDWPSEAHTMIGRARLRNLRELSEDVLRREVKGDMLEAGVWRGGACILMRGILSAYGIRDRKVWVADSFAGLPEPDAELYPADAGDAHHLHSELAVSLDEVRKNFAKYNLLDEQVVFLPGWFKDTLPVAPIDSLSILRLDGDMYSSTIETMQALYAKVSHGGYVIVDDYFLPGCRKAIMDFRTANGIDDPIEEIDGVAVFWKVNRRKKKAKRVPARRSGA